MKKFLWRKLFLFFKPLWIFLIIRNRHCNFGPSPSWPAHVGTRRPAPTGPTRQPLKLEGPTCGTFPPPCFLPARHDNVCNALQALPVPAAVVPLPAKRPGAAPSVYIEMSPWPPPFTMMGRQGYVVALKRTLSRGWLKYKKGRTMRTCLLWIQPHPYGTILRHLLNMVNSFFCSSTNYFENR
jgi:hypothetical protein